MRPAFEVQGPLDSEQFDMVRQFMLAATLPLELRLSGSYGFRLRAAVTDVGGIHLYQTQGTGPTGLRTTKLARDDTIPRVILVVMHAGSSRVVQHGRVAHLTGGDMVVFTSTGPLEFTCGADTSKHTVMIPRDDLGLPASLINSLVAVPIGPRHPLSAVLTSYVSGLARSADALSSAARAALELPTIDLVRALLTTVSGDDARGRDPLARTLGVRIQEYLALHFADRDLSPASIAHAHGISQRYLYVILTRLGISLGDWVRDKRLAAAADALGHPSNALVSIASIAHRWGFADHAHFSRTFRQRYGTSPTEWRRTRPP